MRRLRLVMTLPFICVAAAVAATPSARAESLQLTPSTIENLDAFLERLAEQHRHAQWCTEQCVSFNEMRFEGTLAQGRVDVTMSGSVISAEQAFVPLFGAQPWSRLEGLRDNHGTPVQSYWSNNRYVVALPPGAFSLRTTVVFAPRGTVTFSIPGPVGRVHFDVPDAELVGSGSMRAVRRGTYQLAPTSTQTEQSTRREHKLRLTIDRAFRLARDKTFVVHVNAQGAQPGQVIPFPLLPGEDVQEVATTNAALHKDERRIDWVAASTTPSLTYSGKWTSETIALTAPAGSHGESWRVRCEDPFLCSFKGDAETPPGSTGHLWSPLPGQHLNITWKELAPESGMHTAAQAVAISTRPIGDRLEQKMRVRWLSSNGDLASVTLPQGARINRFIVNDTPAAILRDADNVLRVDLPSGTSTMAVHWDLPQSARTFLAPPMPQFAHPVATLWQRVQPAVGSAIVFAGGLPGTPRIALWPNLIACMMIGVLLLLITRWQSPPLVSPALWFGAAAGFAIASPLALLPLAFLLIMSRWFGTNPKRRSKFRAVLELSVWVLCVLTAVTIAFTTLETALFSDAPIAVESFVRDSSGALFEQLPWNATKAEWATFIAGAPQGTGSLPAVWTVSTPLVVIRLVWAVWAVIVALFFFGEGRLMLVHLKSYWGSIVSKPSKPTADSGD